MDINSFRVLISPQGQKALQVAQGWAPREADFLSHFQALQKEFPAELARAALETAILRLEARIKFPQASELYFTRQALEQASSWEVSSYSAERFRPYRQLVDLGCSIGGDTLSLAEVAPTLGIDRDPLRLAMAQANLRALGLEERTTFLQADLSARLPLKLSPDMACFFDPARRSGHRRAYSVQAYTPALEVIRNWLGDAPALGVKISPGVKMEEIKDFDAEIEFISLRGELKEAVLWFGPLRTTRRRATLLPGPHWLTEESNDPGDSYIRQRLSLSEPRAYLYEPDPAVLRAGLVEALGAQLEASQLDADIAYLTNDERVATPFARVWAIEDWFPFSLKRLRAYLRVRRVGQVVVKKRGSPLQPEDLIQKLRLKGDQKKVLFLTHLKGRPIVVVCTPEAG